MARLLSRRPEVAHGILRERARKIRITGYKGVKDAYGHVQGTLPEKIIYGELSKRNIPFYFQTEVDFNVPELSLFKKYRPDFVLFNDKVIIEVQGAYFHSTDDAIEADAYKFAIYELLGYKVYAWWDFQILRDLPSLLIESPEIMRYGFVGTRTSTEVITDRKRTTDDSKGIRTMNYNRGLRQRYKKKSVAVRRKRGISG